MDKFYDNQNCFVCGMKNPRGLRLTFDYNEELDRVEAEVTFPAHLQGWGNVVHGGLISTVLDEIMIKAAAARKLKCVTGEITVKFKKPTLTNKRYTVTGKIIDIKKRIAFTEGSVQEPGGKVTAYASGKLFMVD